MPRYLSHPIIFKGAPAVLNHYLDNMLFSVAAAIVKLYVRPCRENRVIHALTVCPKERLYII